MDDATRRVRGNQKGPRRLDGGGPHEVQSQLSVALRNIARHDFWQDSPLLLPEFAMQLNGLFTKIIPVLDALWASLSATRGSAVRSPVAGDWLCDRDAGCGAAKVVAKRSPIGDESQCDRSCGVVPCVSSLDTKSAKIFYQLNFQEISDLWPSRWKCGWDQ